jgi:inner membrane protein
MLFFGHTGITLGIATVLANLPQSKVWISKHLADLYPDNIELKKLKTSPFDKLAKIIDLRLLLIGSLLPDIIDKPLGHIIFRETISNGRTFCHTLLFLLIISPIGIFIHRKTHKTWLIVLAFGTGIHLILDQMWRDPQTLFWPLLNVNFEKTDTSNWIPKMIHTLVINPGDYIPEAIGLGILLWAAFIVMYRKRIWAFLRHGIIR